MPKEITTTQPVDLSGIRDDGMKALVMFAVSIGYTYNWRSGRPITLWSPDQTEIVIPTQTSINANVFRAKLAQILTHYDAARFAPTVELIDDIIANCKPSHDQQRLLRMSLGETTEMYRARMKAIDDTHVPVPAATQKRKPDEHLSQTIGDLVREPPKVDPEIRIHEVNFATKSGGDNGYFYESPTVLDRIYADGTVEYICRYCHEHGLPEYQVKMPSGIGWHWGKHIDAGEVEKTGRKVITTRRDGVPVKSTGEIRPRRGKKSQPAKQEAIKVPIPVHDFNPTPVEEVATAVAASSDSQKLHAIRQILDSGETERLESVLLENERLTSRVHQLEADLRALKDILGGIS